MFAELRELLRSGAIRRHQSRSKGILTPMIHGFLRICKSINHIYYALSFRQIFTIIYVKPTESILHEEKTYVIIPKKKSGITVP